MKHKARLQDLAVFGGEASFTAPLHVGRPNIGDRARLLTRINDILDTRWLSNHGPYVQELEQRIADLLGVKHCIAMANGTIALEIAIRALDLTGEVIIPSMTFIATAHALQWQQITPVFCDIESKTLTLDPARIEERITPRTTGIMGVHIWGRTCHVERLAEIAARHKLKLLFDASHAFHVTHKSRMIGTFGDAEIFSFHATKFFNTFEGGAVVTNNDDLAAKMRLMKNFGFSGNDNVIHVGTNGKMPEISAAMGLTGLESLDHFIAVNYRNYKQYARELKGLEGITLLSYDEAEQANYQYIVLDIDKAVAGLSRDTLVTILGAENVLARRYFYPGCHRMEPYRSLQPNAGELLPITENVVQRMLTLPTGTAVTAGDVRRVCEIIRFALEHAGEVRSMLTAEYAYA